jgi:hypothetical protein
MKPTREMLVAAEKACQQEDHRYPDKTKQKRRVVVECFAAVFEKCHTARDLYTGARAKYRQERQNNVQGSSPDREFTTTLRGLKKNGVKFELDARKWLLCFQGGSPGSVDLSVELRGGSGAPQQAVPYDQVAERTYFKYRDQAEAEVNRPDLIEYLAKWHKCEPLSFAGRPVGTTIIWPNTTAAIEPDTILGELDTTGVRKWTSTVQLPKANDYAEGRRLIEQKYQEGRVKHEALSYCVDRIDLRRDEPPTISGYCGRYYDMVLTQHAVEWELRRALALDARVGHLSPGVMPMREAIANKGNPLVTGCGRCSAMGVSTLAVLRRPEKLGGGLWCLIKKRASDVAVARGYLQTAPAGMFEGWDLFTPWSVEMNIYRELLEEVYGREEFISANAQPEYVLSMPEIKLLQELRARDLARLSVTGICCDLRCLWFDICTVLYVDDPTFLELYGLKWNWEYEDGPPDLRYGRGLVPWGGLDEFVRMYGGNFVASSSACLSLGREWVKNVVGC